MAASAGIDCVRIYDVGLAAAESGGGLAAAGVRKATYCLAGGTKNFTKAPAMTQQQLERLMSAGAAAIDELPEGVTAVALDEVGIGNTTAASALYAALALNDSDDHFAAVCGRGTGLDDAGVARKVDIVGRALRKHASVVRKGRTGRQARRILAVLGGAEIAAMAGAALRAHEKGLAVVVGGFIATSAALAAAAIDPAVT